MNPSDVRESYARMMDGEPPLLVRRYTGQGPNRPYFDTPARGKVVGYSPDELVGSIIQGDSKVILLVEDLIRRQFPMPVVKDDKVVIRGAVLNIQSVDDKTRRVGGVLVAYELQVRGF